MRRLVLPSVLVALAGCAPQPVTTVEAGAPRDVRADVDYIYDPQYVSLHWGVSVEAGGIPAPELGLVLTADGDGPVFANPDWYRDHVTIIYVATAVEVDMDPPDPWVFTLTVLPSEDHVSGGVFDQLSDRFPDDAEAWLRSFEPMFGVRAEPSQEWVPGAETGQIDLVLDGEVHPAGSMTVLDWSGPVPSESPVQDPPTDGQYVPHYFFSRYLPVDILL